jgi:hypothetical protein
MANAYRQGEHICTLFDTEDEHVAVAAEYLAHGPERDQDQGPA